MDSGLNLQRLCGILFFYNRVVTWLCSVQDCFVLFCCNEQHLFALPVLPWARVAKVCRWYCRYLVSWEQNYVTGQLIIGSSPIKSHTVFSCWAVNLAFVGCCKFLNDILREISLRVCECTLATFAGILTPPFPQIDIIGDVVIVWRVRGKTIRSVLCYIVCNNCAQCDAHTCEQTNSSLDWVLSHWAHFTVLDSFLYCVLLCVVIMIA